MSNDAICYVKKLTITSSAQKLLLMCIADRISDDTFDCFPSQKLLGEEASMSERQVREHLAALERAGIIKRWMRHRDDGSRKSDLIAICGYENFFHALRRIPTITDKYTTGGNPPDDNHPTGGFTYDQPAETRRT